ncbi:hypothetical protein [Desertivibrio insolitus]|uniref:hypothetical protein n=1 Tax=Herbiconiux sp. SYSU D00978 TaxID=2812562 RepID=UPI001A963F7C|nr:hypothetical protein [Herbiconiux sp. SYSU D00978]
MSRPSVDPAVLSAAERLGWSVRETGNPDETMLGDCANGFLLLDRGQYVQLARRSEKGAPALKLWSPDVAALQSYLAAAIARLVRYREGIGPDIRVPSAVDDVAAPAELVHNDHGDVFLRWGPIGSDHWAGFGRGAEPTAVQFSHFVGRAPQSIIDELLSPTAR